MTTSPQPALRASDLQRIRQKYRQIGNELDANSAGPDRHREEIRAHWICTEIEDELQLIACMLRSADLSDALVTALCAAELFESMEPVDNATPSERQRHLAVDSALTVIMDALLRNGADPAVTLYDDDPNNWLDRRLDTLKLAAGDSGA